MTSLIFKDSDMMTEVGRVRSDMQQKINLLQERGDQYSSQCAKIAELDTRLSEQSQRHHEVIHSSAYDFTASMPAL